MITKEGYQFAFDPSACSGCNGACCRGESGYIWVNRAEIEAIVEHLGIDLELFASRYLRRVRGRYSLREYEIAPGDFACIFFDPKAQGCTIYEVRPKQCATFPFWSQYSKDFKELEQECPGIVKR